MEKRKDVGNLIYKKNSGLNELLEFASPPPPMIYKQRTWLLTSAVEFGGAEQGGHSRG